jgi:hypothetical protein
MANVSEKDALNYGGAFMLTVLYPMFTKALKESETSKEAKRIQKEQEQGV